MKKHKRIGISLNSQFGVLPKMGFGDSMNSVTVKCPFCNGKFTAGMTIINGKPGVVHDFPFCVEFMNNEVTEFLKLANAAGAK